MFLFVSFITSYYYLATYVHIKRDFERCTKRDQSRVGKVNITIVIKIKVG